MREKLKPLLPKVVADMMLSPDGERAVKRLREEIAAALEEFECACGCSRCKGCDPSDEWPNV